MVMELATDLAKRGYRVTVVTGVPNYPQGRLFNRRAYLEKNYSRKHCVDTYEILLTAICDRTYLKTVHVGETL
jgi:hypothetical protein